MRSGSDAARGREERHLIEDEDGRIADESAGDGHALPLAA